MIQITLDDRVINVSTTLTVEKYQQIRSNPIKYSNTSEILALYLGVSVDELKDLPVDQIKFVEGILTQHLLAPKVEDIVFTFQIDDVTYGIENDWGNMTWGQWTDLEVFSQPDKIEQNIHVILALLYRPVRIEKGQSYTLDKYKSSEVMERAELFRKKLGVDVWFGCASFFLLISNAYIINIKNSMDLTTKIERYLKPWRRILPKYLLPKQPQDFISNLLTSSLRTKSQSTTESTT
jgi:hypothetical protein